MKKKYLCLAPLILLLTSCAQNDYDIQEIHIVAEDIPQYDNETGTALPDSENMEEVSDAASNVFNDDGCFPEYNALATPTTISGIEFLEKNSDHYLFSFPDNENKAKKLYAKYGSLIQSAGFTLEEYEGSYIIKSDGESIAFMGTGNTEEHNYIMLMAFYTD